MSVKITSWVYENSAAGGTTLLVALALADNANDDGECWPGQQYVATKARCSVRTVARSLLELIELGELVVESGQSSGTINRYRFTMQSLGVRQNDAPHAEGYDTGVLPGYDTGVLPGKTLLSYRTVSEPSVRTVTKDSPSDRDFDAFWNAYPLHVGKQAAARAYAKAIKHATAEQLISGALRYAADPNREGCFTAHASTWLNAGRWTDEPLPARARSGRVADGDALLRRWHAEAQQQQIELTS